MPQTTGTMCNEPRTLLAWCGPATCVQKRRSRQTAGLPSNLQAPNRGVWGAQMREGCLEVASPLKSSAGARCLILVGTPSSKVFDLCFNIPIASPLLPPWGDLTARVPTDLPGSWGAAAPANSTPPEERRGGRRGLWKAVPKKSRRNPRCIGNPGVVARPYC